MADDSDADDDDSFTVTQIAVTGASNSAVSSGTTNSDGTSVTGTYGTLVVGANGTYTYVADQDAADDLDAGDTATDSFTYTISDGDRYGHCHISHNSHRSKRCTSCSK